MDKQREMDKEREFMKRQREIEELLASDDELPLTYNETPETPAYLMDSRFEPIRFPWITESCKVLPIKNATRIEYQSLYQELNAKTVHEKIEQLEENEEVLLRKGVLSQIDLFSLKCIISLSDAATSLWFINFLMYKDLNCNYNFLNSCLVPNYNTKSCLDDIKTGDKDTSNIVIVVK